MLISPLIDIGLLSLNQRVRSQSLERQPEATPVTEHPEQIAQYDEVLTTKFPVTYGIAFEALARTAPERSTNAALDLACGPGHFTLSVARYLGFDRVVGLDLSNAMLNVARKNAFEQGLGDRVSFRAADIRRLDELDDDSFDQTTFTFAAHHMNDLESVSAVVRAADRVTHPSGVVLIMDGVRPKSAHMLGRYMLAFGWDFYRHSLYRSFEDMYHSIRADWTIGELRQVIPAHSRRRWCQITPFGYPFIQLIIGYPAHRSAPFVRNRSQDHAFRDSLRHRWEVIHGSAWTRAALREWKLLEFAFFSPLARRFIAPLHR